MTPRQREVFELRQQGLSFRDIAATMGLSRRTVREHFAEAKKKIDPVIQEAMASVGTGMVPEMIWAKNKNFSVMLRPKQPAHTDVIARLQEAFKDIPAAPEIPKPEVVEEDLLTAYPFFDVHYGMKATAQISGKDYDYKIAAKRLIDGTRKCMAFSPNSKRGVIINGGDFTHADDDTNQTPRSKHVLDVAGRNYTTLDGAIELISNIIELALKKHEIVEYYSVPGNHDPKNWVAIMFALAERYRNNPRVKIERSPIEFSVILHGKSLIAIHHGDIKRNPKDLVLWFAATYPIEWSSAEYRTLWYGHNHSLQAIEMPGMVAERFSPVTVADHYANSNAFTSFPMIQAITFNQYGEFMRIKDRQR